MLNLIGKFIANQEIVSCDVIDDLKTPSGGDVVSVVFKDGAKRIYPVRVLDYIVTDKVSDLGSSEILVFMVL